MANFLSIMALLAGVAFAASAYFAYLQNNDLTFKLFIAGLFIAGLAVLLWLIHVALNWFSKRYVRRSALTDQPPSQPRPLGTSGERFAFGVYWDADLNPLCPVCRTPLILSTRNLIYPIDPFNDSTPPPVPIPHCLKCDKALPLYDDEGKHLSLAEAKRHLALKKLEPMAKALNIPPTHTQTTVAPQPPESYQPDETDKKIISYLYKGVNCQLSYIADAVGLDDQETKVRLNRMTSSKYVRAPRRTPSNLFAPYKLTDKGIQFAIDNGLREQVPQPAPQEVKAESPEPPPQQSQTTVTLQSADSYKPNETAIEILKQIYKGIAYESEITNTLKLNRVQTRIALAQLEEHDYIKLHSPENRAPYYTLTDKGNDELKKPIRTLPHPSGKLDEKSEKILAFLAHPPH